MKAFLYAPGNCLNTRKCQGLRSSVSSVFLSWVQLQAAKGLSLATWVAVVSSPSRCLMLSPGFLSRCKGGVVVEFLQITLYFNAFDIITKIVLRAK